MALVQTLRKWYHKIHWSRHYYMLVFAALMVVDLKRWYATNFEWQRLIFILVPLLALGRFSLRSYCKARYVLWTLLCALFVPWFIQNREILTTLKDTQWWQMVLMVAVCGFAFIKLHEHWREALGNMKPAGLVLWIAVGILTYVSTNRPYWAIPVMVSFGVVYLIPFSAQERKEFLQGMMNGIILGFVFVQGKSLMHVPYYEWRYGGKYGNASMCALLYAMTYAALFSKFCVQARKKSRWQWPLLLAASCMIPFTIFTASRSGLVAILGVSLVGIAYLVYHAKKKAILKGVGYSLLLLFFACATFFPVYGAVRYVPVFYYNLHLFESEYQVNTITGDVGALATWKPKKSKFITWQKALETWFEHSFVYVNAAEDTDEEELPDGTADITLERLDIYKAYLSKLNVWGHTSWTMHVSKQTYAQHAHDVFIAYLYVHGIIPGGLFVFFLLASAFIMLYRAFARGVAIENIMPLLLFGGILAFGTTELIWYIGQLSFVLMYILPRFAWDRIEKEDTAIEQIATPRIEATGPAAPDACEMAEKPNALLTRKMTTSAFLCCALVGAAVLAAVKMIFVGLKGSEETLIASAYAFGQSGIWRADVLINALLIRPFVIVTGGVTYLVLYLRFAGALVQGLVAYLFYRRLRPFLKREIALAMSLFFFSLLPLGVQSLDYANLLLLALMLLLLFALAFAMTKKKGYIAGAAAALLLLIFSLPLQLDMAANLSNLALAAADVKGLLPHLGFVTVLSCILWSILLLWSRQEKLYHFFVIFFSLSALDQAFFWMYGDGYYLQYLFCYVILYLWGLIGFLRTRKQGGLTTLHRIFFYVGTVFSPVLALFVLAFCNGALGEAFAYLLPGMLAAFLYLPDAEKITFQRPSYGSAFLVFALAIVFFAKGIMVYDNAGLKSNFFDLKQKVLSGAAKGVYMEYVEGCQFNRFAQLVEDSLEGETLLLVGYHPLWYLGDNITIAHYDLSDVAPYDEALLDYWAKNPEKTPTCVILAAGKTTPHVILNALNLDVPTLQTQDVAIYEVP